MREIQTLDDPGGVQIKSDEGWVVYLADKFNLPRVDVSFNEAPTSPGLITVTKKSGAGSQYDTVIRTINPVGQLEVTLEGLHGFANGDKIAFTYDNPDNRDIEASANLEIPLQSPVFVEGMSISDGKIRSHASNYRRYYHVNLLSSAPGGSGANYEDPTVDYLGGMRLNAPTDVIQASWDINGDWDTSVKPELEANITTMVAGVNPDDILKFRLVMYYAQPAIPGVRTQTFTLQRTVGPIPQYTFGAFEAELDTDVTDNPILPGDRIYVALNVTADSDITDVVINHASFSYATTHVGIEQDGV